MCFYHSKTFYTKNKINNCQKYKPLVCTSIMLN